MSPNIDDRIENADWTKKTWDIHQTFAEWIRHRGMEDVDALLRLPASDQMPAEWRADLDEWVAAS